MSIEVGLGFGTALGCGDEVTDDGDVRVDVNDDVLVMGDGDVTTADTPDGVTAAAGATDDDDPAG